MGGKLVNVQGVLILDKETKSESLSSLQSLRKRQGRKRGTSQRRCQWDQSLFLVVMEASGYILTAGFLYSVAGASYLPILNGMCFSSKSQAEIYCRRKIWRTIN